MAPLTLAKIALAVVGAALFMYAVRVDNEVMRWIAIALVALAFLLRFVGRRGAGASPGDGE